MQLHKTAMETVIRPTIRGMAEQGMPFTGFLYAGLMISPDGETKVLEFNVRFGDPETQPIMMRLQSDLAELCLAAVQWKTGPGGCKMGSATCPWCGHGGRRLSRQLLKRPCDFGSGYCQP